MFSKLYWISSPVYFQLLITSLNQHDYFVSTINIIYVPIIVLHFSFLYVYFSAFFVPNCIFFPFISFSFPSTKWMYISLAHGTQRHWNTPEMVHVFFLHFFFGSVGSLACDKIKCVNQFIKIIINIYIRNEIGMHRSCFLIKNSVR